MPEHWRRAVACGLALSVVVDIALFSIWLRWGDDRHLISF